MLFIAGAAFSAEIVVSDPIFRQHKNDHKAAVGAAPAGYIDFWVHWKHAWHNDRNHDAAWIFLKILGRRGDLEEGRHVLLMERPVVLFTDTTSGDPRCEIKVAADKTGFFLLPGKPHRGDVRVKLRVRVDPEIWRDLEESSVRVRPHALEMVHIPEGPFWAGAASEDEAEYGAFYLSTGDGRFGGPFPVTSEGPIEVGPQAGALHYRPMGVPQYIGDAAGPVPAEFPKGFRAFYIMKYEITQGEYAEFLNGLHVYGPALRANFGGRTYLRERGTIRLEGERYVADSPRRPCNHISWEDGIAFLDWACLRPMTDFEFEKAARGPAKPQPGDYPWGTSELNRLQRTLLENGDIGMLSGQSEALLDDSNRDVYGASYYWVMDLCGSLWEKVVTIGHEKGRRYRGSHGDGIAYYGEASREDWPREFGLRHREFGFGYRGGGFYQPLETYSLFRPHSPVSLRPYGAWSGGPRYLAYGFRGVRTVDLVAEQSK